MSSRLFAEKGFVKGLALLFEDAEEWLIGRDKDQCSMLVEDPKVSRRHLHCKRSDEGLIVENLSQTNPLLINDKIIEGPYLLKEGDRLKIGNSYFRFLSQEMDEEREEDLEQNLQDNLDLEDKKAKEPQTEQRRSAQDELLDSYEQEEDFQEEDFSSFSETLYTEREMQFDSPIFSQFEQIEEEAKKEAEKAAIKAKSVVDPISSEEEAQESRYLLKVLAGPMKGAEYPLVENRSYIIGSGENAELVFHDISISRQHAKLSFLEDQSVQIEDLESKNGIFIDDVKIQEPTTISAHHLVSLGTSAFVVLDKEQKSQTLQSALPNIATSEAPQKETSKTSFFTRRPSLSQMSLLSLIVGILLIIGLGTFSLFQDGEVAIKSVDAEAQIESILVDQKDIEFHYNKGSLFLLGHVTSSIERDQIMHDLTSLPFVKNINNNIIIDELVWQETNLILSKNPAWNSISLQAPDPGQFVLTGYLKSNQEAEDLSDYINIHFPYLDRLSNRVVVEEQLVESLNVELLENAFHDIFVEINNGDLSLSGYTSSEKAPQLQKILTKMETMEGIRNIKNFVVELPPEESMIDLSQRYEVTGHFRHANVNVSVVINGRILARGDTLDGMTITSIKPHSIFLEREGFKFKIDYNK